MKIAEFKQALSSVEQLEIQLNDGSLIPAHFHITEVGILTKNFIDCGGSIRTEKAANFQIWAANDTDHRLTPKKLIGIIAQSEAYFPLDELDIEVEYQQSSITKYGIEFKNGAFQLTTKFTDCLAKDHCGIPTEKMPLKLVDLGKSNDTSCCTPGSSCCS